jgi:hypothetical protein
MSRRWPLPTGGESVRQGPSRFVPSTCPLVADVDVLHSGYPHSDRWGFYVQWIGSTGNALFIWTRCPRSHVVSSDRAKILSAQVKERGAFVSPCSSSKPRWGGMAGPVARSYRWGQPEPSSVFI